MTSTHSIQGRPWAKLQELKADDSVELDDDFTCHPAGLVTLQRRGATLFFPCNEGGHDVAGQADDGIHCVGIYARAEKEHDHLGC